jgi:3-oxoacyl-[acyl-carrier-protein] synthase-3
VRCREAIFIAGVASSLPAPVDVSGAVAEGRYSASAAEKTAQLTVRVSDGQAAPEMAVDAARVALARSGLAPGDIGVLGHSALFDFGIPIWNSAAYVARELGINGDVAIAEIRSGCNGLVSADFAVAYLLAHPEMAGALLTHGDVYPDDAIDRWGVAGFVFGDGASAAVLSRRGGFARLLSIVTGSETELEALHRGGQHFGPVGQLPIDLGRRAGEFWRSRMPPDATWRLHAEGLRTVVQRAVCDAAVELAAMQQVVFPAIGREQTGTLFVDLFGLPLECTTWEFGRRTGHLGPADTFAALAYLAESGRLRCGERVLLIAGGGGFVWTVAVAEIVDPHVALTTP